MELEVFMERRKFSREFKLEAVRLIKERGVSYGLSGDGITRAKPLNSPAAPTRWR
jgi:hypothetical protein